MDLSRSSEFSTASTVTGPVPPDALLGSTPGAAAAPGQAVAPVGTILRNSGLRRRGSRVRPAQNRRLRRVMRRQAAPADVTAPFTEVSVLLDGGDAGETLPVAPRTIDLSDRPTLIERTEDTAAQPVSGGSATSEPKPASARPEPVQPGQAQLQPAEPKLAQPQLPELRPAEPRLAEPTLAAVLAAVASLAAWTTMAPASIWLPLAILPATGLVALFLPGHDMARLLRAAALLTAGAVLPMISAAMTPATLLIALGAAATYPLLVEARAAKAVMALGVSRLAPLAADAFRSGPHAFVASLMQPASGSQTAIRIALAAGVLVTGLISASAMATRRLLTANLRVCAQRERAAVEHAWHANATVNRLGLEASRDEDTGLPNREALLERLTPMLQNTQNAVALTLIEINRFSVLSDSLGAGPAGDVATAAGRRLRASLTDDHLVARLSQQQYAVVLLGASRETCAQTGHAVTDCLDRPFQISGRTIPITCSIGTAMHSDLPGTASAEDLLHAAEEAARAAHTDGGSHCVMFDQAVHARAQAQATLEIELRDAVHGGHISVSFQPVLALETPAGTGPAGTGPADERGDKADDKGDDDRIVGAEALAHWIRSDGSTVPAKCFMPMADRLGLGQQLGLQLVEQALDALLEWRTEGVGVDQVWVNLVPGQLTNPGLATEISGRLAVRGLSASCLVLEVSAADLVETEQALASMRMLRSLGVAIALDEFGRSGTSLTALRSMPISAVKLDPELASELGRHDTVPRSIAELCHSLGLRVVVEGVETPHQLHGAREIQADAVQGYAIARPMSAQDVTNLLSLRLPREFRLR